MSEFRIISAPGPSFEEADWDRANDETVEAPDWEAALDEAECGWSSSIGSSIETELDPDGGGTVWVVHLTAR